MAPGCRRSPCRSPATQKTIVSTVYVLGNTYLVQLNGQTLIDKRPLFYSNGLVGYYALVRRRLTRSS